MEVEASDEAFSPLIIGEWTATSRIVCTPSRQVVAFSPLIIGEWTATSDVMRDMTVAQVTFSPLIIGEWTATIPHSPHHDSHAPFQSPNHRGVDCNASRG